MNSTAYEAVLDSALDLPADLRSRLARQLMDSIGEDDAFLSSEWLEEIDRRMDRPAAEAAHRMRK